MVFQDVVSLFRSTFKSLAEEVAEYRFWLLALLLFLVFGGGFYGYRYYASFQAEKSYTALAEYMEEYDKSMRDEVKDWAGVEMLFKMGHDQHARSTAAPYFLIFQSEALIQQDRKGEALEALNAALHSLSSRSPLFSLYKTKQALLQLDMEDEAVREAGVAQLRELIADTGNLHNDVAAYYLGLYYWSQDDVERARVVWQVLVDANKELDKEQKSPWATKAESKLEQIA